MKCPTCGAMNDPANRFCDQCGSRLEPAGAAAQQPTMIEQPPTQAAATCPNCGSPVLPGEAFCDECGAPLGAAPVATTGQDAPTLLSAPAPSMPPAQPSGDAGPICAACGHQNLPGDQFCDNCGASLAPTAPVSIADAPTQAADNGLGSQNGSQAPAETVLADQHAPTQESPIQAPPDQTTPPDELTAPPAVEIEEGPPDETVAPPPSPTAPSDEQAAYEAERQRLNDEIGRQQQIITQFEQMQSMFGANTPPAVTQGLHDAREARDRAQSQLDSLQPPPPPVDPAEVERLNDEIGRQQQIITQFEQMQSMFGANTPPAVTQGLHDAREAKARAEAELSALGAGRASAPAAASQAPAADVAPAATVADSPAAPPPTVDEPVVAPPMMPAATAPAIPVPPPQPAAPRLVFEDSGKEITLATDKSEIVIGREDPISGIFPEVDLTPHGGESGGVSRQHAKLTHSNGQWAIVDLQSTNYTRVDGNKIEPNVPVPVQDGSRLQLGRVTMVFRQ